MTHVARGPYPRSLNFSHLGKMFVHLDAAFSLLNRLPFRTLFGSKPNHPTHTFSTQDPSSTQDGRRSGSDRLHLLLTRDLPLLWHHCPHVQRAAASPQTRNPGGDRPPGQSHHAGRWLQQRRPGVPEAARLSRHRDPVPPEHEPPEPPPRLLGPLLTPRAAFVL